MLKARWYRYLWFALAMALAFGLGAWRVTMADGESVGFAVNYPASGGDAGGLGPMGNTGGVEMNVGNTGILKRIVQPDVASLSSHWVRNVGDTPRRIRVAAEGFDYPIRWHSTERTWDEETHSVGRLLDPDEAIGVELLVTLPWPYPADIYTLDQGKFTVYDADTGELLTELPISIVNTRFSSAKGGDCCAPK